MIFKLLSYLWFLPHVCLALDAGGWSRRSIYQVLTDRFALADSSSPDCWNRGYCGGTWKGVESQLDCIAGMGFDAIWISPVVHNLEGNTTWGFAYHGYWADDPFKLNHHFGTEADLKSLSDAIHARNMTLMLDVVINHLAVNDAKPDTISYPNLPPPFDTESSFHPRCPIDYNDQKSIEDCWLADTVPPLLADINSEDKVVFNSLVDSVSHLVRTYAIDGIRLDTARHVPKQYLSEFQDAVGVFVTGEVLHGDVERVFDYQGPLNSILNYPLYFAAVESFTGQASFGRIADIMRHEETRFTDINVLGNFLDNHDQPRFASRTPSDVTRDMNAITFLMIAPGIPIVYYGFEQRFTGSVDPENREPMWTSGYDTNSALYQLLAKLHKVRKTDLRFFNARTRVLESSQTYLAMQRGSLLSVVSNAGTVGQRLESDITGNKGSSTRLKGVTIAGTDFIQGARLVDLLSCEVINVGAGGSLVSPVGTGLPRVWVPWDMALELCPP